MSLPAWPTGLPYMPMRDGFSVSEPHLKPLVTEFEGGAFRRRPRSTLRRAKFAMVWRFTPEQRTTFRNFYHSTLVEGSLRFTMLVPDEGSDYVSRTVQFVEMYREGAPAGTMWDISAEIYVFGGI